MPPTLHLMEFIYRGIPVPPAVYIVEGQSFPFAYEFNGTGKGHQITLHLLDSEGRELAVVHDRPGTDDPGRWCVAFSIDFPPIAIGWHAIEARVDGVPAGKLPFEVCLGERPPRR